MDNDLCDKNLQEWHPSKERNTDYFNVGVLQIEKNKIYLQAHRY